MLMNFLDLLNHPATWIGIAAISEIIGLSPLKSNSVVQLLLQAVFALKPRAKG
jgi:hypothetical protein